ncbi:protein of unknown function [Candidatus Methylocalor cossyra]|uniref:Uncharacterized protein n=1 Tax=Candidatus Methylocalor cossyra TaxID=3108543 RepID=A0ABP1CAA8_9GAMM
MRDTFSDELRVQLWLSNFFHIDLHRHSDYGRNFFAKRVNIFALLANN